MHKKTAPGNREKKLPCMGRTIFTIIIHPALLIKGIRCTAIIINKFFLFQFRAVLFKNIPVSQVDHSMDRTIPFNPGFIRIYLDFTAFWIRIAGFLCTGFGKQGRKLAGDFIDSVTKVYLFAFEIYKKNLSTTARPLYKKGFHFALIHLVDPHLMCIPSLHVMLMIHSYTAFRHYLCLLGETGQICRNLEKKVFNGAIAITEAVLYVKQHSINCIAASVYAMNRFNPLLFDAADADFFIKTLFKTKQKDDVPPEYVWYYSKPFIRPQDTFRIQEEIKKLYMRFTETNSTDWTIPILQFLLKLPQKKS